MQLPDLSALSRVPWGLVLGGVTLAGFLFRKSGHKQAQREYPALAERLGLAFKASPYRSGVGRLVGEFEGFPVFVDPDDQRSIRVQLHHSVGLDLSLTARTGRSQPGYEAIRSEKLPTRRMERALGSRSGLARLESASHSGEVAALLSMREVKSFLVTEESIVMGFDFGNPPHIPTQVVEKAVRTLVAWARELETN